MKTASDIPSIPPSQRLIAGFLTVGTDRVHLIGGSIFTAALLALVLTHADRFLTPDTPSGILLYILCLVTCAVLGLLTIFRWGLTEKVSNIVSVVLFFLLPIVAMTMVECMNNVFTWAWSPQTLLLNYILYFLFYGTVYVCSGSLRLSMLIVNPLFFALSLANYYVRAFRGSPFIPVDFLAVKTAAGVAATYDYSFNYQIVISIILLAFLSVAAFKLRTPKMDIVLKIATRVFFGTLTLCIVCIYFFTDQYAEVGLKPDFWNQARGFKKSGVVMNFCLNTKYTYVTKPAGYDPDGVTRIVTDLAGEDTGAADSPNVICIMNESLADLRVLGDLETNVPCMPFLDSLTENTVRGNLYVPVIGSGTSNTEFEFLTGVSTAYFPAGSNAYMLYVKNPLYSLVSTMGDQGYTKLAFHPYYASGWNRTKVYQNFGFTKFTSIGSLIDYDILLEYQNSGFSSALLEQRVEETYGPGMLLRQYISDSYNYRKVIQMFEKRNPDQPFFLFNVTMQNHGGYTSQSENFVQDVYTLNGDSPDSYPRANQYLTLLKRSDEAFEELISYFEQVEEPTVICMFGDHQPSVEDRFIAGLLGADSLLTLTPEQTQKRYVTPFYIWANYDIEEETVERLSANYLSSYVMKVAGVQMPAFNRYLLALSETLPVIDTAGCIDKDGNHYENGASSPYTALLNDYGMVVYNLVHDEENRQDDLYTVQ